MRERPFPPLKWVASLSNGSLRYCPRATKPKAIMVTPEIRLTHPKRAGVKWWRRRAVQPLRQSHQVADPRKIPPIRARGAAIAVVPTTPKPAKMAVKAKIVAGLVKVSSKVVP